MAERSTPPAPAIDQGKKYTATVHTSRGDFVITQEHYYDGLTFHRVVPGFVVQGGDPLGNGTGGPNYKLPDESNPSKWPRGTVGMASSSAGVSGSQFFITLGDAPFLANNGVYNHFGQVTAGMDVIDALRVGDRMTSIDIATS